MHYAHAKICHGLSLPNSTNLLDIIITTISITIRRSPKSIEKRCYITLHSSSDKTKSRLLLIFSERQREGAKKHEDFETIMYDVLKVGQRK